MKVLDWLGLGPKVMPVAIDDATFASEVLRSELSVVLDVWSSSCAPCKQLEPVMMALASAYQGRVKVCEMAVQRAPMSAGRLEVRSTPTVLYLQGGQVRERVTGFRSSLYHEETIAELFGIPKKPTTA